MGWRLWGRYGRLKYSVPWSRAWALAAIGVIKLCEDFVYGIGWLLSKARVRLLVYVGAPVNTPVWH